MKLTNQLFLNNINNTKCIMKNSQKSNNLERTPNSDSINFTGAASKVQTEFINKILKGQDKTLDRVLASFDFARYEDYGIPLKYSRRKFVREVNAALENLPQEKQSEMLAKFGMYKGPEDLEGVPSIPSKKENSLPFLKIATCIRSLTENNEMVSKHSYAKSLMDTILQGFPEFTSIIGKKQHGTHIYAVDIHSLKLLQSAMNNPKYAKISQEGKEVLKFTTLLHDFGKQGGVITPGHAAQSKVYAEKILKDFPISKKLKDRILLHVENHHWFENYNRGYLSAQEVCDIFKTKEDLEIAKILAKGDFENVNPQFHLKRMLKDKIVTQDEFDKLFAESVEKIQI